MANFTATFQVSRPPAGNAGGFLTRGSQFKRGPRGEKILPLLEIVKVLYSKKPLHLPPAIRTYTNFGHELSALRAACASSAAGLELDLSGELDSHQQFHQIAGGCHPPWAPARKAHQKHCGAFRGELANLRSESRQPVELSQLPPPPESVRWFV